MKKSSLVYRLIILTWCLLMIVSYKSLILDVESNFLAKKYFVTLLLFLNVLFISYFWLNGMKDVIYVIVYHLNQKKWLIQEKSILKINNLKKVKIALLYTTKDDFSSKCLDKCRKQNYTNCQTFILDDSQDAEYISIIDDYKRKHPTISVIRRKQHTGFKAGNLNQFLNKHNNFDYFVILDSDEIIPKNFVSIALKYFMYYPNLGIVQSNHIATRNKNKFMRIFHYGVDSHWPTYQKIKEKYGFLSFLGHGAMISVDCYKSVGGFPELVAEDLCFSILARKCKYNIAFSKLITCEEEFPVNYQAFRTRHYKWTLGNFELMRKFSANIFLNNELRWFEKLDVFLFTYNLPLTFVFFIFLVINILLLPLLGYPAKYPLWLILPTIIFLFSPMFNDIYVYFKSFGIFGISLYCLRMFLLYGSLFWISFYGALSSLIGRKAKFYVTPKVNTKYSLLEKIKNNRNEMIFGLILAIVTIVVNSSILPSILIVFPSLAGMYLDSLAES